MRTPGLALLALAFAGCIVPTEGGNVLLCPTPIHVSAQGSTIFLMWGHVTNATGFTIGRGVDNGTIQADYGAADNSNHPSFTDTNVTTGHTYHYYVASNTGLPPQACAPVDGRLPDASVPFFTGTTSLLAIGLACVAGFLVLRRK